MKKIIYLVLILTGILSSCRKSEYTPKLGNPDDRLSEQAKIYQTLLLGGTYGWKAFLETGGKEIYTFTLKFNDQNRVSMTSDINATTATSAESSYRFKSLQNPTLLFDTYSYLHMLADPTPGIVPGGNAGTGHLSDFEYTFESSSADTIKMVGIFNKSKLLLVRSKSQAETDALLPDLATVAGMLNNLRTYFKLVTYNGVNYEAKVDAGTRTIIVKTPSGDQKVLFYVNNGVMKFLSPIVLGDLKISEISNLSYDGNLKSINGTASGKPFVIKEAIAPLVFDATAAQKWYNQKLLNFNDCWVSDKAFHANGVDDFCNFKNIPNYQTLWYAGASVFGGANDGMITFTTGLAAPYTFSKTPVTITNGIARFTLVSSAGTFTGTTPIALAMSAARNLLYGGATANSSQDWYLIPTSDDGKAYDMVRVSDALAWISWRPR